MKEEKETYILVGVATAGEERERASLCELADLLETAGGEAIYEVVQNLPQPDMATYLGKGKAESLKPLIEGYEATGILCDDELSPAQIRNLSDLLDAKVIDRTILILDIFAAHARTGEGKIQVEMAQQKYRLSHLAGLGKSLSRLGGGIGTRGPGESKLEEDRRRIQKRISMLSGQIRDMKNVRETTRKRRQFHEVPVVAIVGYTNAGKSTLLNKLTASDVLAEDKLFATLDPTTRVCRFPSGQQVLLTDTVGFINKLPHNLIDAFRSTLEEAKYADIILHVVDASDPEAELHMQVVYQTLRELDVTGKPIITAFNKSDRMTAEDAWEQAGLRDEIARQTFHISAKQGDGLEQLCAGIEDILKESRLLVEGLIPYERGADAEMIRRAGQILEEEYCEDGIRIKAYVPERLLQLFDQKNP